MTSLITSFNAENYNLHNDPDMWKENIEENEMRPLTMKEFEQWYEVVANSEMNSQVHYLNYLHEYKREFEDDGEVVDVWSLYRYEPNEPETDVTPETNVTTVREEEELLKKLDEVSSECYSLKQENAQYKTLLFQNNLLFSPTRPLSPTRPSRPSEQLVCPPRPERKKQKAVRFINGTPTRTRLFPVKTERSMKKTEAQAPHRFSKFFKASELLKKLDNPQGVIISE